LIAAENDVVAFGCENAFVLLNVVVAEMRSAMVVELVVGCGGCVGDDG
jgi:hypothetical protein